MLHLTDGILHTILSHSMLLSQEMLGLPLSMFGGHTMDSPLAIREVKVHVYIMKLPVRVRLERALQLNHVRTT
uniref:Uncharacterized protein n=1 Tax=Arundo donax TaxID=35708 RepID=A0A0A9DED2_ARUDO